MFLLLADLPNDPIDAAADAQNFGSEFIERPMKLDELLLHEIPQIRNQHLPTQFTELVFGHRRIVRDTALSIYAR